MSSSDEDQLACYLLSGFHPDSLRPNVHTLILYKTEKWKWYESNINTIGLYFIAMKNSQKDGTKIYKEILTHNLTCQMHTY